MADLSITQRFTGGDYGRTATRDAQPFRGIVVHVTGKPTLQSEIDYSSHPDPNRPGYYGYSYLIDRDGKIYQVAPDNVRTNHIMPNNQYGLNNSNALGVALVGGAKGASPEQLAAGQQLIGQLTTQFGIDPRMVMSHGELDPKTRGPGMGLGANDTAEGYDLTTAFRKSQSIRTAATDQPAGQPTGQGEVADYIAQRARTMGIDPNVALRVARAEGLNVFNPNAPDRGGDGGSSFGPFQLHYGGINPSQPGPGLGDEFTQATGFNASDPSTWRQQVDFSLQRAAQGGWGPWHGAKAAGIAEMAGIPAQPKAASFPASTAPSPVPGTTITSTPQMDPSIAAGGPGHMIPGVAPAAVAAGAPAPAPAPAVAAVQKGDIGGALQALTQKTGAEGQGKSALESAASALGGQQQQQQAAAPESQMLPPAAQIDASMIPAAQQLMSQILAQSAKPLTWTSRPFGSGTAGPQVPGATLNTTGGYGYG